MACWPIRCCSWAFARLWSVAHKHGYVTAADFVRGRFGSRSLALAVALTGIAATIPYIALQLLGHAGGDRGTGDSNPAAACRRFPILPLLIAFLFLAFYTYSSGLRGTAVIAIAKDIMIYATVLAAIVIIPIELGGYGKIFASIDPKLLLLGHGTADNLGPGFAYSSLALGSVLALFLYPHAMTGMLSSSSRDVVERNSIILPIYSFALALIALLGFMAVAAGVKAMPGICQRLRTLRQQFRRARAVPAHVSRTGSRASPSPPSASARWCRPRSCRSPAAIFLPAISIANSSPRTARPQTEAQVAKIVAFVAKLGALFFVLALQKLLCHRAPASGRHLDLPDRAGGAGGAVHPRHASDGAA